MCRSLIFLFHAIQTGMYVFESVFYKCKQTFNVTKLSTKEIPGLYALYSYALQTGYKYIDITKDF